MSKNLNSGHNGMISRKYGWDQLVITLKNPSITKILDENNNIKMDDKVSILKQILNEYVGALRQKDIDINIIKNTNSYRLLAELCSTHPKKINKRSFPNRWNNLMFHALKKSNNCRNQ